jgi:hypothetical protein
MPSWSLAPSCKADAGSVPIKMSKTTPCKVAGGMNATKNNLTRRANQRHFFIIPQPCKFPSPRHSGRVGAIAAQIRNPIEIALASPRRTIACAWPNRAQARVP